MIYEIGAFIAGLIKVYQLVMLVISLNSTRQNNLRKLGLRISWMTQEPKALIPYDFQSRPFYLTFKISFVLVYSMVHVAFSWLFVVYWAALAVWHLSKTSGMPQHIKEFRWHLNNVDMSKEKLIEEFIKLDNLTPEQEKAFRDSVEARLSANPNYKSLAADELKTPIESEVG